ncbi:MAG: DUF3300 domain-containing protein [Burkholderiaceae bacterium]|nr:DUF3300 domain-containing protein [Burkholderiaceae bacterium]
MNFARQITWLACAAAAAVLAVAPATPAHAQASAAWRTQAPYTQQELDQMLAPIALYPDALVAQVLMAATYPLEVVQAARFVQRNRGLGGEALERAVAPMGWDPSVAALTQCPSVLAMMSEELDWTQRLGEAFLAQREQVMDTVQALRARAYAAGSLRSTEQQHVIVQDRVILVEPWQPGILWVPYYNPLIVYGTWWWPAYPPFVWVPPVVYRPPYFPQVYSVGIVWGPLTVVLGSLWHDPRPVWRSRPIVVDNAPVFNVIVTNASALRPQVWHHDPAHRRRVEYRTPAVRERYQSLPAAPGQRVAPPAAPRAAPTLSPRVAPAPRVTPTPQREREGATPPQRERERVAPPSQREREQVRPAPQREQVMPAPQREQVTPAPQRQQAMPAPQREPAVPTPRQPSEPALRNRATPPQARPVEPQRQQPAPHRQPQPQREPRQSGEPQQRGPQ